MPNGSWVLIKGCMQNTVGKTKLNLITLRCSILVWDAFPLKEELMLMITTGIDS